MTTRLPLLLGLLLSVVQPLLADNPKIVKSGPYQTPVLELYTSEGCSSCPPADEWLSELARLPQDELDVLPLAFHVDYWDYIGWKDEFADPAFTARQRYLGRLNKQRSIYTPEFFVDGKEARGTSNILSKIRKANQTPSPISLQLSVLRQKMQYQLRLNSQNEGDENLRVQFFVYENDLSNQVKRGENAGRTLQHQRVVRYLSPLINLKPDIEHAIDIDPEWQRHKLGIGALVRTSSDEYVQSVHATGLSL